MRTAVASGPAMVRKTSPGFVVSPSVPQIQRPRERGGEDATSDAQRAFGIRLPADERELLRLSPEIGALGERLSFFLDSRLAAE